ncbi:MAG TPA: DinB family protein [Phycisphaerae bacterium]|jgi:uncharacterized damage-inducible protein DinB
MIKLRTIRELLRYSDWANQQILSRAAAFADEQLDRAFEMGMGSLRRTLLHIHNGEHVWLERLSGRVETPWPSEDERASVGGIEERFRALWTRRDAHLVNLDNDSLSGEQTYRDSRGGLFRTTRGAMLLQMCTHSTHHRAQALNMLRHSGATLPKPGADYIFMRLERPSDPPPEFDLDTIRAFFEYGDWAQSRVLAAAEALADEQLDRPFEIGVGSLRKTVLHIRFAEQWWLENWTVGPGKHFPELPLSTSVPETRRLFQETAARRNEFIAKLSEDGLERIVEAHPRPDVVRRFPLGVTLLQLCNHGVHHRAQAVNMLRRVGAAAPELDYMMSVRRPA